MWHYKTGTSWNFVIYANIHALGMLFNRWNRTRNRERSAASKAMGWGITMVLLGVVAAAACRWILDLDAGASIAIGVFAAAMFLFVTVLPMTGSRLNTALHVGLTFHFSVLSRIFFRSPDFATAKSLCAQLLTFEGAGIRSGLLPPELWAVLILGTAYHWTPKAWVDVIAWDAFRRIPGWALGVLFAALSLWLMHILAGAPKAFVYFQF